MEKKSHPPRLPHPGLAARLVERRHELGIGSLEAAAEICGITPQTYTGAEKGTLFTQTGKLGKIADGFKLDLKDLVNLRDGRPVESAAIVSADDLAFDAAIERLRALPTDFRQPVVRLINGLADALS